MVFEQLNVSDSDLKDLEGCNVMRNLMLANILADRMEENHSYLENELRMHTETSVHANEDAEWFDAEIEKKRSKLNRLLKREWVIQAFGRYRYNVLQREIAELESNKDLLSKVIESLKSLCCDLVLTLKRSSDALKALCIAGVNFLDNTEILESILAIFISDPNLPQELERQLFNIRRPNKQHFGKVGKFVKRVSDRFGTVASRLASKVSKSKTDRFDLDVLDGANEISTKENIPALYESSILELSLDYKRVATVQSKSMPTVQLDDKKLDARTEFVLNDLHAGNELFRHAVKSLVADASASSNNNRGRSPDRGASSHGVRCRSAPSRSRKSSRVSNSIRAKSVERVADESGGEYRQYLAEELLQKIELFVEVMAHPDEFDPEDLVSRFNGDQLRHFEKMVETVSPTAKQKINKSHLHNIFREFFSYLNYSPDGTPQEGTHCMPLWQCCIRLMTTSLASYFGKRCCETLPSGDVGVVLETTYGDELDSFLRDNTEMSKAFSFDNSKHAEGWTKATESHLSRYEIRALTDRKTNLVTVTKQSEYVSPQEGLFRNKKEEPDDYQKLVQCADLAPCTARKEKDKDKMLMQYTEFSTKELGLKNRLESYAINFINLMESAMIYSAKHNGRRALRVGVGSALTMEEIFGKEGLARFEGQLKSNSMELYTLLHPQAYMMGVHKAKRYSPDLRDRMLKSLVTCYARVVGIPDDQIDTYVENCNFVEEFGRTFVDIELGVLSHLPR